MINAPLDVRGWRDFVKSSRAGPGTTAVCRMVRQFGPDGAGDHPAGRAHPGLPALLDGRHAGGVACDLCHRQSRFHRGCRPASFVRSTGFLNSSPASTATAGPRGSTARCCGSTRPRCGVDPAAAREGGVAGALHGVRICCGFAFRCGIFVVMAAGMLWTVPSNLVAALYRARGLYGRAVRCRTPPFSPGNWVSWSPSSRPAACWPSPLLTPPRRWSPRIWLLTIDAPRLFPFRSRRA